MQNQQVQLARLAKKWNLTNLDTEEKEFILTPEEVEKVKADHVKDMQEFKSWKLKQKGLTEESILLKISKVNWQSINFKEVIQEANEGKHRGLELKKFNDEKKLRAIDEENKKREFYNAKFMFNFMAHTSEYNFDKKFVVNKFNTKLIKTLCFFFSDDERFVTELGYSFSKGLWIRGKMGIGKTHCIKCIAENEFKPVLMTSMIEINEVLTEYGKYDFDYGKREVKKIYIDDVGTEEPLVNHYGTKIAFFKTFIETSYLKQKKFSNLIISTNLDFNGVEKQYGARVRSRIKDMFNIVDVEGDDMRGK
jgi:DNA replication protein DnaC